jgi:metacaspase-1
MLANEFSQGRALVMGVANYPKVSKLPENVLNDARDLASVLQAQGYCAYPPANVELLLDEQATADRMRDALLQLAETAGPDDRYRARVLFGPRRTH